MRAIPAEVLAQLDRSVCAGNSLTLTGQLDPKLYRAVNKVVEAAGGKWNRKAGCHVFDGDAGEAIEQVILSGGVGRKQELGQFDTPPEIAARVVSLAEIEPGMRVLEPSAGIGCLALPALRAGAQVLAVEIDQKRSLRLVSELTGHDAMVLEGDFLTFAAAGQIGIFDRVVMNPPFARQADIDHVMAAERRLKPGGVLVAVMSAGIGFRTNSKTFFFRQWLAERGDIVDHLAADAFRPSGTSVSACIVKLTGRGRP